MNVKFKSIEKILDYQIVDQTLFVLALTHRSVGNKNNERLEFLGDAVLDLVVAEDIYLRFSKADEGQLSRMRARLVKGDTLAKIARDIGLADHLILGSGEMKSGGRRRASILAGTLEALIGAIYLDSGYEASQKVIRHLYTAEYEQLSLEDALKDPKTRLQEYCQSRSMSLPSYKVLSILGEGHNQVFTCECSIKSLPEEMTTGESISRRKAEQQAAASMLVRLGIDSAENK